MAPNEDAPSDGGKSNGNGWQGIIKSALAVLTAAGLTGGGVWVAAGENTPMTESQVKVQYELMVEQRKLCRLLDLSTTGPTR